MSPTALYGLQAPAKLNLFLHILGRRTDGYHLLQSVFVLIDWCDELDVVVRTDGVIERRDVGGSLDLPQDDLCVKAARLLQQHSATPLGASIVLRKHLPAQAGLGGGSSDAASCLLALNRLWNLGLSRQALADLGLRLGADVPFFVHGQNAWVQGVGEQIQPLPPLDSAFCVVLKPPLGVSTQAIFTDPDLQRDTPAMDVRRWLGEGDHPEGGHSVQRFLRGTHNDLQPVAERLCPSIVQGVRWLEAQGWVGARMSGSGSAVFALCPERCQIETAPAGWQLKKTKILRRHPNFDLCSG